MQIRAKEFMKWRINPMKLQAIAKAPFRKAYYAAGTKYYHIKYELMLMDSMRTIYMI